jgi:hypothetical protein
MPRISAKPADGVLTNCSIVGRRVSTADVGATLLTVSRTASVVLLPWPKTPSSDTSASSAGNSDSTA